MVFVKLVIVIVVCTCCEINIKIISLLFEEYGAGMVEKRTWALKRK